MKTTVININNMRGLIIALLLLSAQTIFAQLNTVTGPSPVNGNTTHTYEYSDGLIHSNRQWVVSGGTVASEWYTKFPTTYKVSVTWANGTSGTVTFKSNGITRGSKSVVINPVAPPSTPTNLSDENYIHNITPRIATTDVSLLDTDEVLENVSYFDGLGRPVQSNAIRGGSAEEDIITHVDYDVFGRQTKEYLPYTLANNGGAYKTDALSATKSYYDATKYNDDFPGMTTTNINPFSEKEFEPSPQGLVLKQAAPGYDWRLGGGHEIEFDYQTNDTLTVRYYKVSLSFANNTYTPTLMANAGFYNPGELSKTITYDENHSSGNNHSTEEFKDKQGRVVLKKTYNAGIAHDTYYVYDDYGNLTYVLPPKVVHDSDISGTELSELCYQYKYDHRNRLVEKKIPGKDWEYIVYNQLDKPVLTQDANLRAQNKWLFTKYDQFGRVAYTGEMSLNISRTSLQTTVNGVSSNYVTKKDPSITIDGTDIYYTNAAYPVTNISEIYTINYYDNYTFDKVSGNSESSYGVTPITNVKGQATGTKVRVLGTNNWITTVNYYDSKYRPIYVYSHNAYLNTTDKIKSSLDFSGTVLETTTTHARTGFSTITTVDAFEYDHMNRLLEHKQTINGGDEELIAQNTYDELGQLITKKVGNTTSSPLQTVDYKYNIRGWLTQINNPNASLGNDLFGFNINYNSKDHSGTGVALYNGNISETEWKTANDNVLRYYQYAYDALNRITDAISYNGNYDVFDITYDKNGNINTLKRDGKNHATLNTYGIIDNLTYVYESNSSNKLKSVNDSAIESIGFSEIANTSVEYNYDANGNMTEDDNKGITSISYNHLNLPTSVSINNGVNVGTISYIYDATGVKLKKTVSSTGVSTYYAGNYVYEGSSLKFFNHPEGYIDASGSAYEYVYQYKDHLGNIRLSYKDVNQNNPFGVSLQIQEENNYYPFGLKHKGYNTVVNSTNIALKRMFGGKEYQGELGLGWYDVSARNYDPALARWMNLDPLAEQMRRHSPYNYAFNNPIFWTDPDGMAPSDEWNKNADGTLTWVSNKGGDNVDYVNNLDEGGNIVSTDEINVVNLESTCNTCSKEKSTKSPGIRSTQKVGQNNVEPMSILDMGATVTDEVVTGVGEALGVDETVLAVVSLVLNPKKAGKNIDKLAKRVNPKKAAREAAKKKRAQQPASEDYVKYKAKKLEKKRGKDARRNAHDKKSKGQPDRSKKQIDEDYNTNNH